MKKSIMPLILIATAFFLLPHIVMLAVLQVWGQQARDWLPSIVAGSVVTDLIGAVLFTWAAVRFFHGWRKGRLN